MDPQRQDALLPFFTTECAVVVHSRPTLNATVVILAFFAVLLVSYANGAWLLRRMRKSHPSVWAGLQQPSLAQSNVGGPRLALFKYLWSLSFRKLQDSPLVVACWGALAAEVVLAVLFVLFVFSPQ